MTFPEKYNPADAVDILRYAKWLIGRTFYDVLEVDYKENSSYNNTLLSDQDDSENPILDNHIVKYGNVQRKGGLGNLIEEHFFHYSANSSSEADFSQAGLELNLEKNGVYV